MAEQTPLLERSSVYDRFTPTTKHFITFLASMVEFIDRFTVASFIPCVPQVAKDLNTTGIAVNYTLGVYMLVFAVGTLIWAPYAGFFGRRPVYLASLPLVCIGGLLASRADSLFVLIIGRSFQAFGTSCALSTGAATISDIYELEKRGTAMGIYFGSTLMGPLLGPLLGGWVANFASWRVLQLGIGLTALVVFILVVLFLPETSHPGTKGADKYHVTENLGGSPTVQTNRWRFVGLNPFRILLLLRSPVIVFVSLCGSFSLIAYLALLVPMPYTLGKRYGIDNPASLGACMLPVGIGCIVGAVISGRFADTVMIRQRRLRQGKWIPEDRLLTAFPGLLLIMPFASIFFALSIHFIPGQVGLIICLICIFFTGIGMEVVLAPCSTYLVDLFHSQGAEVVAVAVAMRQCLSGVSPALALPMINQFGIIATYTTTALLLWLGSILLYITIKHGDKLRGWVDMDYITVEDS